MTQSKGQKFKECDPPFVVDCRIIYPLFSKTFREYSQIDLHMKDDDTWKDFQAKLRKSGVLSAYAAQELLAQDFVRQEHEQLQQQEQQQHQQGNHGENIHKGKRTDHANTNRRPSSSIRRNSSIEDVPRTTTTMMTTENNNISSSSFCSQDSTNKDDHQKLPPSKLRTMMRQSFHLAFLKRPEKKSSDSSMTMTTPNEKIRRQEKFETHVLQTSGIQPELYPQPSYMPKRRSSFCLGSRELSNNKPLLDILDTVPNHRNPKSSWNTIFLNPKDETDHMIQLSASIMKTIQLDADNDEEEEGEDVNTKNNTKKQSSQDSDPSLVVDFPIRRRLSLPSTIKNGKRQPPRKSFHVVDDGNHHDHYQQQQQANGCKDTTMTTTTPTTTDCPNKPIIAHVEMCSVRNLKNLSQDTSESQDESRNYMDDSSMYDDSSTRNHDYFN